jgi:hypothetical protein
MSDGRVHSPANDTDWVNKLRSGPNCLTAEQRPGIATHKRLYFAAGS